MNREELIESLAFLNGDARPTVELFILDKPQSNNEGELRFNVYKGRMHQDMPDQFADMFFPKIKKLLLEREYDILDYEPALTPDRRVIWQYPTEEVPLYNEILNRLPHIEDNYYDDDELPYENIWALWIKFYIGNNNFFLLKKITPSKVLETGSILACVFNRDVFKKLNSDVLKIDSSVDVIAYNNLLIFENKQHFENVLQYDEIIQEVATQTLEQINEIEIIENFDTFKEYLVDDYHSLRKLNILSQKQYFREKTFDDYKRIIEDYNVGINSDPESRKFIVTDKEQAKLLIKVLNDDYLKSELTNIKYAANSKEDIT